MTTLRFYVRDNRPDEPFAIALSVADVAELFMAMNDDQQARFFCECARIGAAWREEPGYRGFGVGWQWYAIGRHLATCECSTEDGRGMLREITAAMEQPAEVRG